MLQVIINKYINIMNIKKLLVLSALAMASFSNAFAQDKEEEAAWTFVSHWYIQLQAGASETLGEAKFFDLLSPAAQVAVGYQFNPNFSARVKANGWQAKGGWVNPEQDYKFNQVGLQADVRFDLTNLFGGYNPERLVSVGIFAGGGINMAWGNEEAQSLSTHNYDLPYLWDGTKIRPVGNAGLDVNFRVSERVSLGLEANAHIITDKFNSKKAGNADWMFNALLGAKIALGKTYERKEAPVPVQLVTPEPKPVEVAKPVEKKVEVKKEVENITVNLFFSISSAQIRESEMAKLNQLVTFLKENPTKTVYIKGFADKGTGNANVNKRYSEQRVKNVTDALVKAGIAASRIKGDAFGDTVQPFSDNASNRVCICVSE